MRRNFDFVIVDKKLEKICILYRILFNYNNYNNYNFT